MNPDDLILISVHDHIAEPETMFDAHVPAKYRDRAPKVLTHERGIQQWWYGNVKGRNLGLNAVAGKPPAMFNVDASRTQHDFSRTGGPTQISTWPQAPEELVQTLAGLSDAQIDTISHQNAMRHYQFDPFRYRPRERCTAAALRAESPDVDVMTHVGRPADDRDLESWRALTTGRRGPRRGGR